MSSQYDLSVPGKYVVQLQRHLDYADSKSPIVKSNEITITVLPKKLDAAQEPKPVAGAEDNRPFTVTISGPQTVAVGDDVVIHVVLKNVSNHAIQIELAGTVLHCLDT